GLVTIIVDAKQPDLSGLPERTFVNTYGYISIEAEHYHAKYDLPDAGFQVIEGYGRTLSGLKVFPTTSYFEPGRGPSLEYLFAVDARGTYDGEWYTQHRYAARTDTTLYYSNPVH